MRERTKKFALRVIKLVQAMPRTPEGRNIANQLVRAGTSVGANYRASCKSRSRAEFIARMGVVEEEADECYYWLEIIIEAKIMDIDRIQPLLDEAMQLTAIAAKSRITASRKRQTKEG